MDNDARETKGIWLLLADKPVLQTMDTQSVVRGEQDLSGIWAE